MAFSRVLASFLSFTLLGSLLGGTVSYEAFLEVKNAEKEERIAVYKEYSDREAEWILSLQQDNGAVFLYEPSKEGSGHVYPYFACQAMLGVISDGDAAHIKAVGKYLKWHTKYLLKEDGIISDYKMVDGKLKAQEDSDSFDSYAAEYMLLLAKYLELGGNPDKIGDWKRALALLSVGFDEVMLYDVTFANQKMRVAYLMDNSEVWQGAHELGTFLKNSEDYKDDATLQSLATRFLEMADTIQKAIERDFFLEEYGAYNIAIDKEGKQIGIPDFTEFYPDAVAQLYPALCGMRPVADREKDLYNRICGYHDWENGNIADTVFDWSVMSYAATVFKDDERLDAYLALYKKRTDEKRSYPRHTANSGWVMRACNKHIEDILNEKDTGFFDYIKWLLGDK